MKVLYGKRISPRGRSEQPPFCVVDRIIHRSVYRGERDRVDAYARPRWWCCSPHQLTLPLFLLVSQCPGPLINKQTSVLHKKPRFINSADLGGYGEDLSEIVVGCRQRPPAAGSAIDGGSGCRNTSDESPRGGRKVVNPHVWPVCAKIAIIGGGEQEPTQDSTFRAGH